MAAGMVIDHVANVEKQKLPTSKGLDQKYLDYFYNLADISSNVRLKASLDIIQNVLATASPSVC